MAQSLEQKLVQLKVNLLKKRVGITTDSFVGGEEG